MTTALLAAGILPAFWRDLGTSCPNGHGGVPTDQRPISLDDGRVLFIGGSGAVDNQGTKKCDIFGPSTRTWSAAADLNTARIFGASSKLADGRVLVSGGFGADGTTRLDTAEIYDPDLDTWTLTAGNLPSARNSHGQVTLDDGTVLIIGGSGAAGRLSDCAIFTPGTGLFAATGALTTARSNAACVKLADGSVLAAGGTGAAGKLASAERFTTNAWAAAGSMSLARAPQGGGAVLLRDGRVFVAGGGAPNNATATSACDIYTPGTNTWAAAAALPTARNTWGLSVLRNSGRVLQVGGDAGAPDALVYEYNPDLNTWAQIAAFPVAFNTCNGVNTPDGTIVLIADGDSKRNALLVGTP